MHEHIFVLLIVYVPKTLKAGRFHSFFIFLKHLVKKNYQFLNHSFCTFSSNFFKVTIY